MTEQPEAPLGQRHNAIRVHRLLIWFFAISAVFFLGALVAGVPHVGFKSMTCLAMAAANYLIANEAERHTSWAQIASMILAGLMLIVGVIFFMTRPDIQAFLSLGETGASFIGSFAVVLAVVQVIAAIYILLNGNWQQPVPPGEKPDSNMRP